MNENKNKSRKLKKNVLKKKSIGEENSSNLNKLIAFETINLIKSAAYSKEEYSSND